MSMATDQIESDLEQSRHRLNDTLNQLGRKLSPGQMLDEGLGLLQGQAGQFAAKLGRQVRDNPLPTVLVASGIAWLMMDRSKGSSSSQGAEDWGHERRYRSLEETRWSTPRLTDETDEEYENRVHTAYAKTMNMRQYAGEAVHDFKARVSRSVEAARHAASSFRERMAVQGQAMSQGAARTTQRAHEMYFDNPLAAGAIAVAIGALIGGATPLTDAERNALGGMANSAARASKGAAEKAAEKGAQMAEKAVEAMH
jgi:ElaB/YqjD/DUF883 family membrane-anchored ribosome-binding protein